MIHVPSWMEEAVRQLKAQFGPRLLFVGLQGSYRRGEAREDSDIDILTILDTVDVQDLALYRRLLHQLPEGEKACGFTCGRKEMMAWPALELFQFAQDTDAYYGELESLLPPVTRQDMIMGTATAASSLYHATAYLYVTGDEDNRTEDLKALYKAFYFPMVMVYFLRHGRYAHSKRELFPLLAGDEAELLRLNMDPDYYAKVQTQNPDRLFQLLLAWAGTVMRTLREMKA